MQGGEDSGATPIPFEEWCGAVAATEGVRLSAAHAFTITNPATGEVIRLGSREGDAEVYFPQDSKWYTVFRWLGGSAAFTARFEPGDKANPAWSAAAALAKRMNAAIRGDGGELYQL
jgi:hypothetical protein